MKAQPHRSGVITKSHERLTESSSATCEWHDATHLECFALSNKLGFKRSKRLTHVIKFASSDFLEATPQSEKLPRQSRVSVAESITENYTKAARTYKPAYAFRID